MQDTLRISTEIAMIMCCAIVVNKSIGDRMSTRPTYAPSAANSRSEAYIFGLDVVFV